MFTKDIVNHFSRKELSRIHMIDETRPYKLKGILGKARLVISVPLHPIILAASEGVPVISLAYASKSTAFMKEIGMEKYISTVRNVDEKVDGVALMDLIDNIDREHDIISQQISEKMISLKQREKENLAHLMKVIQL